MSIYYQDDLVTLYHGDCLEITEWLQADVLVTDPPYGRDWKQGTIGDHAKNDQSHGIANDIDTSVRDNALRLWGNRPALMFGDLMLAPPAETKLTGVYYKTDPTTGFRGAIGGVRRDAEAIYFVGKGWGSGLGGRSSVFASKASITGSAGLVASSGGHPHTKPADVMGDLLCIAPGGVVGDPFAGSGSTLVAARNLGRSAIGVELEEKWCELIAKRLSQQAFDFGVIA